MPDFAPLGDVGRTVRGSWYSQLPQYGWRDPEDRPGSNALGVPDTQQGIALPSRATLGQWFNVTTPDGRIYRLQQTDVGPGRSTGRGVDISAAAAHAMGYTPGTFPTDANFTVSAAEPGGYVPGYSGGGSPAGRGATGQGTLASLFTGLAGPQAAGSDFSGLSGPFTGFAPSAAPGFTPQAVQFAPLAQIGAGRYG